MAGMHQIWKMPIEGNKIEAYAGNGREDIVDIATTGICFHIRRGGGLAAVAPLSCVHEFAHPECHPDERPPLLPAHTVTLGQRVCHRQRRGTVKLARMFAMGVTPLIGDA